MQRQVPVLLASLSLSLTAAAQEAPPEIEDLLVLGERVAHDAVSQSTVLDSEAIRLRNSASTLDLLRHAPGLSVFQPGGPGGVSEVLIRGSESNYTVVTLDGVPMNHATDPRGRGFDFATINPDDIERVEVLRGSLSSLYGSEALAGAINIVTRPPAEGAQLSARVEGGSDDYQRGYLSLDGGRSDGLMGRLSLAHLDSGEPVPGSTSSVDSVRLGVDWSLAEHRQLDLRVNRSERERTNYPVGSGGPLFAVHDGLEHGLAEQTSAQVRWQETLGEDWAFNMRLSHFQREEEVDTPGVPDGVLGGSPGMTSETDMRRQRLSGNATWHPGGALELAAGAEVQREAGEGASVLDRGEPVPTGFDLERDNLAAFVEGRYRWATGTEAFVSTRVDKHEDHSAEPTAKLSLSQDFATGTRLGLSWGNAFKVPTFYALGDGLVGNPDLAPETSDTLELSVQQNAWNDRLYVNLALFRTRYDQLIEFSFEQFQMINWEDLAVDGAELEAAVQLTGQLSAGGHLTELDYVSEQGQPNERAETRAGLHGQWESGDWQTRVQWLYVGERPSASSPTGDVRLGSYQRWDISAAYQFTPRFEVSANVDNLLDEQFQEEAGFPSPGRMFRMGLSVKL